MCYLAFCLLNIINVSHSDTSLWLSFFLFFCGGTFWRENGFGRENAFGGENGGESYMMWCDDMTWPRLATPRLASLRATCVVTKYNVRKYKSIKVYTISDGPRVGLPKPNREAVCVPPVCESNPGKTLSALWFGSTKRDRAWCNINLQI